MKYDIEHLRPLINKVTNEKVFDCVKRLFEEIDWSGDTKEFEKNIINLLDRYGILERYFKE